MQALKARILALLRSNPNAKSPEAEAEQILFHVLRMSNHSILKPRDLTTHPITPKLGEITEAIHIAENRARGVPLQHLLGYQFFYSHEYSVDSSTLIPRPETEILIDEVIRFINTENLPPDFHFAELGLGSGILSCELLSYFPRATGSASELNAHAIKLAEKNLEAIIGPLFRKRLSILEPEGSETGFEIFLNQGPFDLILSNPPYLDPTDELEDEVVQHEPGSALFPAKTKLGFDANYFYQNLITHSAALMKENGALFLEVPHERADELRKLFLISGFDHVKLFDDLTGRPRVLMARLRRN